MTPWRNQNRWMQPERRQGVRIVTLRNFGWATIALGVVFGAITIRSEMRGRHMHDYGRLYRGQMARDVAKKTEPVEVVQEAAPPPRIADQTPAMAPMMAPAMSSPVMSMDDTILVPVEQPQQQATIIAPSVASRAHDSRVAIVGGAEGVAIVQKTEKRPLLKGGFGRQ